MIWAQNRTNPLRIYSRLLGRIGKTVREGIKEMGLQGSQWFWRFLFEKNQGTELESGYPSSWRRNLGSVIDFLMPSPFVISKSCESLSSTKYRQNVSANTRIHVRNMEIPKLTGSKAREVATSALDRPEPIKNPWDISDLLLWANTSFQNQPIWILSGPAQKLVWPAIPLRFSQASSLSYHAFWVGFQGQHRNQVEGILPEL